MARSSLVQHVVRDFEQAFGASERARVAFAPGRVNLIGEHTDYNDGFVLPMAIDRGVAVAFAPRRDALLRVRSVEFDQTRELTFGRAVGAGMESSDLHPGNGWVAYVAGVAWTLRDSGLSPRGADLVISGDLPIGAGLSSSAGLEIAVARALAANSELPWDPRKAALSAQKAEHEFVGVACGVMDQLVVALAREGSALLIDCRSLETRDVAIPASVSVVVFDSGVRRELSSSAYNERRQACARAVDAARAIDDRVRALRDVDESLLARVRHEVDPVVFRRAAHVIAENRRPGAFAEALEAGDLPQAGRLMLQSHASLRDLYEVSCPELDILVELASAHPSCFGARLTGAGFGGCAIALVRESEADDVIESVTTGYSDRTGRVVTGFACRPAAGATLVAAETLNSEL